MRTGRLVIALLTFVLVGWSGPSSEATTGSITARQVVGGLDHPAAFTIAPDGRIFYAERTTGRIRIYDQNRRTDRPFFRVPDVLNQGYRGLLGLALHPDFPATPFLYAFATRNVSGTPRNQIVRIDTHRRTTRVVFTSSLVASDSHEGGRILFGPDKMLYAVIGDEGDPANAQDLSNPAGKILRMTPTGQPAPGDPFGHRIYAYGFRNSFGFDFDPKTGNLWESENGPECNDELNRVVPGHNYGWGPHETCSTPPPPPRNTNQDGPSPTLPLRWYSPPIAPTGIVFCSKCGLGPASDGKLFFGAYNTGEIRRVGLTNNRLGVVSQQVVYKRGTPILSMETSPDGHLFFSDRSGIYRLVVS